MKRVLLLPILLAAILTVGCGAESTAPIPAPTSTATPVPSTPTPFADIREVLFNALQKPGAITKITASIQGPEGAVVSAVSWMDGLPVQHVRMERLEDGGLQMISIQTTETKATYFPHLGRPIIGPAPDEPEARLVLGVGSLAMFLLGTDLAENGETQFAGFEQWERSPALVWEARWTPPESLTKAPTYAFSRLYLEPHTFLPLGQETEVKLPFGEEPEKRLERYQVQFIEPASLPGDFFDPWSLE